MNASPSPQSFGSISLPLEAKRGDVALPELGTVLAGKYRIDRVLGEGGMGIVFEAMHLRLQHRVAIKMLLPAALGEPDFVSRFEREARAVATLQSPHVATIFDVDTSPEGLPYMVIEHLDGHDLAAELAARGPLPIAEAVTLALEACVPIALAHTLGIVHRDLKPSNLFIAKHPAGTQCLKLIDFGISKVIAEDEKVTSPFQGLGTPHYMSPEQVRSSSDVDQRADVWSLGVILYELLTGVTPFDGSTCAVLAAIVADPLPPPRGIRADIPQELEDVIMHALEKDLDKRFQDVHEFARALTPFAPERARPLLDAVPSTSAATTSTAIFVRDRLPSFTPQRSGLRKAWMLAPMAALLGVGIWLAQPAPTAATSNHAPRASIMLARGMAPAFAAAHAPTPAALPVPASITVGARATKVADTLTATAIEVAPPPAPPPPPAPVRATTSNPLTL